MTPLAWINFPLALAFILAIVGIPLWMTFKRPQTAPDHSAAHAYLAARTALAGEQVPGTGAPMPAGNGRTLARPAARRGPPPARRRRGQYERAGRTRPEVS